MEWVPVERVADEGPDRRLGAAARVRPRGRHDRGARQPSRVMAGLDMPGGPGTVRVRGGGPAAARADVQHRRHRRHPAADPTPAAGPDGLTGMPEPAVRASRRPGPLALVGGVVLSLSVAGMAGAWVELSGRDDPTVAIEIHYSHYEPSAVTVPLGVPVTFTIHNGDPIDHEWIVGDAAVHERHRTGTEPVHGARPTEVTIPAGETGRRPSCSPRPGRSSTSATSPATRRTGWSARSRSAPAEPRARDTDRAPRRREARSRCDNRGPSGAGAALRHVGDEDRVDDRLVAARRRELDVEHAVGHLDHERLVERRVARPGLLDDVE